MTRVTFVHGARTVTVEAAAGARLLELAQDAGQPLEGTCGGQLACATCHVIVAAEDFAKLPPASVEEEDMLDLVRGAVRYSRLACQVRIDPGWAELRVTVVG